MKTLWENNIGLAYLLARRYAPLCQMDAAVDFDDLMQSAFLGLVRASQTYEPEKGAWSTWAAYYIRTAILNALGFHKRQQVSVLSLDSPAYADDDETSLLETITDDTLSDIDESIISDETAEVVRAAVNALDAEDVRRAMQLFYLENRSAADVADIMGVEGKYVRALVQKGLRQLRREITQQQLRCDAWLDKQTNFMSRKSTTAFFRDQTSVVESAVIWREHMRQRRGENHNA